MKIAVLYQSQEPPPVNGIRKPMKDGGYRDSGADLAFCLQKRGIPVALPVVQPCVEQDLDWVFPDNETGIRRALQAGADTFWLNTVLYASHPIAKLRGQGIWVVGQDPAVAERYDDKYQTNRLLQKAGLPVAEQRLVSTGSRWEGEFPCVLKPVRGRGSQGVARIGNQEMFLETIQKMIQSGRFGDPVMAEPYLPGREMTVSVLPDGTCLPVVERFRHQDGIAPYSGNVAVAENSRAVESDQMLGELCRACAKVPELLGAKALIRIDCRQDKKGDYRLFDVNLKPNMTGSARPHRKNQDSLTMLAAAALGWSYGDLLEKLLETRWKLL